MSGSTACTPCSEAMNRRKICRRRRGLVSRVIVSVFLPVQLSGACRCRCILSKKFGSIGTSMGGSALSCPSIAWMRQRPTEVATKYKTGRSPWDRRATAEGLKPSGWARSAVGRFRKNKESTRARHTRDCVECTTCVVRHIVQYHVRVVCWVISSVVPRVAVDSMLGS